MEYLWVCTEQELKEAGRKLVDVDGKAVALFSTVAGIFAISNRCPHHAAPLVFSRVSGEVTSEGPGKFGYDKDQRIIACPWHRREIDLDTGEFLADKKMCVPTYPVKIENGEILVGTQPRIQRQS